MTEFNSKIKKNSRILKIFMFSICALFACAISSHAQSLVKGTVTDGIGEPLPGVSVVVKGTTNGTITDVNGKYSIQATAKDILSFSYVGMSDQEIKVAGQTTINVVMKDDVAALDEVIGRIWYCQEAIFNRSRICGERRRTAESTGNQCVESFRWTFARYFICSSIW